MFIKWFTMGVVFFSIVGILFQENQQLQKENQLITAELKTLQENYRITEEAYKALSETQLQISTNKKVSVRKIKSSPKRHNAPIAPVLIQVLEVLP